MGSGTADSTTFLRGDRTWAAPPAGGGQATPVRAFARPAPTTSDAAAKTELETLLGLPSDLVTDVATNKESVRQLGERVSQNEGEIGDLHMTTVLANEARINATGARNTWRAITGNPVVPANSHGRRLRIRVIDSAKTDDPGTIEVLVADLENAGAAVLGQAHGGTTGIRFGNAGGPQHDDNVYYIGMLASNRRIVFATDEPDNYLITIDDDELNVAGRIEFAQGAKAGNVTFTVETGAGGGLAGQVDIPQDDEAEELSVLSSVPAISAYSVGDIINVLGDLLVLADSTDHSNQVSGVAARIDATYNGAINVSGTTNDFGSFTDPAFQGEVSWAPSGRTGASVRAFRARLAKAAPASPGRSHHSSPIASGRRPGALDASTRLAAKRTSPGTRTTNPECVSSQ